MKFKVGDKVRIVEWKALPKKEHPAFYIGEEGWIDKIDKNARFFPYHVRMKDNKFRYSQYTKNELELVIKPGQQLEFDFMKE